jgi:hypothetical protein
MGWICDRHGIEAVYVQDFCGGRGNFGELKHIHVESGMILKWTLRHKSCRGVEWLHLTKDKGQGMAVMDI